MEVKKADDYQTWFLEEENHGILIDPWLDNKLVDGKGFLLQREKEIKSHLSEAELNIIKSIIITAPFEDHLHLNTIAMFPEAKIYTTLQIKKILHKKKIHNEISVISNQETSIGPLSIESYKAGFPYNTAAISLLIKNKHNKSVFHEGHVANLKEIKKFNLKADVAILTSEEVKFLGILPLGMNNTKALKTCNLLGAKELMITGSKPSKTKGFITNFLSMGEFDKALLQENIKVHYEAGSYVQI